MEVDIIMYFYVLKKQISSSKDGQGGSIFMNTYFLLNKIKLILKNAFLIL